MKLWFSMQVLIKLKINLLQVVMMEQLVFILEKTSKNFIQLKYLKPIKIKNMKMKKMNKKIIIQELIGKNKYI